MTNKFIKTLQEILIQKYQPNAIYIEPRDPQINLEFIDNNSRFEVIVILPTYRLWFKPDWLEPARIIIDEATQALKASLNCQKLTVSVFSQKELNEDYYLIDDATLIYRKKINLSIFLESPCLVSIIWFFLSQLISLATLGKIDTSTILAGFIGASLGGIVGKWLLLIYR
ncbi:MAG: hypothetical protein HC763_26000 [Hydrococcus sp. CRU_1_1]|nr:hypothetical protein [Hydrococcus sp. CRU_1_1]